MLDIAKKIVTILHELFVIIFLKLFQTSINVIGQDPRAR